MGGEKGLRFPAFFTREGSPPRGRGKVTHGEEVLKGERITPAWAGKSSFCHVCQVFDQDHPRVGGEKRLLLGAGCKGLGSPPRGRGKVWLCAGPRPHLGITPAWAGKSLHFSHFLGGGKDHPRVGGEKCAAAALLHPSLGSPPRGRGKEVLPSGKLPRPRITPAWAGKRLKRSHRSGIFISGPIPFHSVLHRPAGSGGSRAGRDGSLAGQPQNAGPA